MTELGKKNRLTVKPISAPKPYDILANQLREGILRGEIMEGDSLPTERELVSQTGLTRGSVREALRVLAVEGLVQTRQGRFGGNVVTLPGNDSMANAVSQFVRGRRLPLRTIHETRETLEPALARIAAKHRTDDDLKQLEAIHKDLIAAAGSFQEFSLNNIKWHNAVAQASGNELLSSILYSISYGVAVATTTEEYDTIETRKAVIKIHSRINDAIEARDADAAERLMRQHIGATETRAVAPGSTKIPLSSEN